MSRAHLLFIAAVVSIGACHRPPPPTGAPASRGNVVRDPAAARADTARGYQLIQAGKFAAAEPILKRAIEEDSTYGPAANNLGLVHYQLDRLYEAAWEFENAIKLMPNEAQPHNNLGLVLEKALKLKDAEQEYTRAHELAPQNPQYAGNLARLRIRLGERDDQTRRLLEQVLLSDSRPDWVEWARFNLTRLRVPLPDESRPATRPQ